MEEMMGWHMPPDSDTELPLGDIPVSIVVTKARSRVADGRGVGANSDRKYDLFRRALGRLIQVHFLSSRGRGLLVDMHAHDGGGVEKRQYDMFGENVAWSSSRRLIYWKKEADRKGIPVDLVLCERNAERRAKLAEVAKTEGIEVTILKNNKHLVAWLMKQEQAGVRYDWGVVTNDPCGPKDHGVEVLAELGKVSRLDFVLIVNELAVKRLNGLQEKGHDIGKNAKLVASCRKAAHKYDWVMDCCEWARRVGRKRVLRSSTLIKNRNHHGRCLVLTNHPTLTGTGFEAYTI